MIAECAANIFQNLFVIAYLIFAQFQHVTQHQYERSSFTAVFCNSGQRTLHALGIGVVGIIDPCGAVERNSIHPFAGKRGVAQAPGNGIRINIHTECQRRGRRGVSGLMPAG